MDKEIIRQIIIENQEIISKIKLIERNFEFEPEGNYVLTGVRHAGKSYLLFQRALMLLKAGHKLDEFAYLNFDDERLYGMSASDFNLIIEAYRSLFEKEPIFFFDEIQNIDGWDHFARRLANQKYRVFITGSNAKMLSRDIASVLGERYLTGEIYPYSFDEYLRAKKCELTANWEYTSKAGEVNRLFKEYFTFGGFPEILKYQNKRNWLNSLFERIFLSDMVIRNKIRNEDGLRMTIRRLAETVKQPTSYGRISNLLKATGLSTSPASVMEYVRYMRESCLIFSLENYRSKFVVKATIKKHYFVDNGLLTIFLQDAETSLLENLCAIYLHRKYGEGLYYFKTSEEVDFYIPEEGIGIQVSFSLKDPAVREREIKALQTLHALHPLKKMIIVTWDEKEEIFLSDNCKIDVVPVWKWLLGRGIGEV